MQFTMVTRGKGKGKRKKRKENLSGGVKRHELEGIATICGPEHRFLMHARPPPLAPPSGLSRTSLTQTRE